MSRATAAGVLSGALLVPVVNASVAGAWFLAATLARGLLTRQDGKGAFLALILVPVVVPVGQLLLGGVAGVALRLSGHPGAALGLWLGTAVVGVTAALGFVVFGFVG